MEKTPTYNVHACARKNKKTGEIYCRYLYPREIFTPLENKRGHILDDPHRED